jgi:hypothetical protein
MSKLSRTRRAQFFTSFVCRNRHQFPFRVDVVARASVDCSDNPLSENRNDAYKNECVSLFVTFRYEVSKAVDSRTRNDSDMVGERMSIPTNE